MQVLPCTIQKISVKRKWLVIKLNLNQLSTLIPAVLFEKSYNEIAELLKLNKITVASKTTTKSKQNTDKIKFLHDI